MKVLHAISNLDARNGGPVTALLGLADAQTRCGLNVSVVANYETNQQVVAQLRDKGVTVHLLKPPLALLQTPRITMSQLEGLVGEAHIIHIHGVWEEVQHQVAHAARKLKVPYIIRACGMLDPWSLAQSRLKKQLYMFWRQRKDLNEAVALHLTSQTECDLVRPLKIDVQYVVEPNGVNCDEFKSLPLRGTFRQKYQIRNDQLLILFFSRIHPKKGLDLLIPAFAKTKITGTTLVIAGPSENDYRAHLDKMVQKYEIQDQVIFTGMLEGKERISALRDADVFVLPSYQENFGIAVVESLASGTPVIISDQVNIHDQITAAKVGGVVSTNIDALAEELARWLSDGKLRQEAARRARPFVQTQYDWQKIAQRWKERYAQLVTSA